MYHITIKDIARQLNVSVSTVSRAFNNKSDIKKETKELILHTAKKMGYKPNPIAKKLIERRSYNIGLVVPEFVNPFFSQVSIGVQEVLAKKGYQLLITQSNESYETELLNVKNLENSMVDGIIMSLTRETDNTLYYKELIQQGLPIVFFNRVPEKLNATKVIFNDYKWAFFATEHLIQQGCKNIVHLKGISASQTISSERSRGYKDAMKKHKLSLNQNQIISTGFTINDGKRVAELMIKNNQIPDGIFAINDDVAIGAMTVFKTHGYKIPKDIAFVGFTESKIAPIMEPPLTSVIQPTCEIGIEVAKLIIHQIENENNYTPQTITLNGQLNIRASSLRNI
ncbi:LacI family DNA-binding transcriptional regulator [uncultured Algibacter sp.]|uniref:LacI family DNA-binding transcriptional regulator n=1 Tax=uncultured Algibacter sp. TaxID=298659 RepID=UPI002605DD8F|nr:LacI family DNA-binding transcriptional regulator [uncultured Algibacter sp.]